MSTPHDPITLEMLTTGKIEEIRTALYTAFEQSCRILALADNSLIGPDAAAERMRLILAPLQMTDSATSEEDEKDVFDDPCEPHDRWTEQQMIEGDRQLDALKDLEFEKP